jgi:hypothetical protein
LTETQWLSWISLFHSSQNSTDYNITGGFSSPLLNSPIFLPKPLVDLLTTHYGDYY